MPTARPPTGSFPIEQVAANPPTTMVPKLPAQRRWIWKDVALGLALAGLLVTSVLAARAYFSPAHSGGTLVVGVASPKSSTVATVFVDGQERDRVESGKSLIVRELPAGPHVVRVTAEGAPDIEEAATVPEGDVVVLMAMLQPATKKAAPEKPVAPQPAAPQQVATQEKAAPAAATVATTTPAPTPPAAAAPTPAPAAQAPAPAPATPTPAPVAAKPPQAAAPAPVVVAQHTPAPAPAERAPARTPRAARQAAASKPAAGPPGFLIANTQPWAKVLIDGHDTGKSTPIPPVSKLALKPGKHTVTFVIESGKKFPFPIEIVSGEDFKLIKTLGD
jgi:hypothetical protein